MNLSHRNTLLLSLALLALAAAVYWPGLSGGFLFDDFPNIVTNTRVQADGFTWDAMLKAASAYQSGAYGRPLATMSFAIDYLISGKEAWGYKITSLAVHLLNALLVFWLLRRVLALPKGDKPWTSAGAFAIALLWAIHPIQISSVLYIVQRMETLSLTFVLLALIAYLRGRTAQIDGSRGWPWLVASGLLAGMGMLSKESAVLFPAYTLALELTVLGFDAYTARTRRFLKGSYAIGGLAAVAVFLAIIVPQHLAPDAYSGRDFNLYERLLTQLRVLPMYLGQILLPLPGSMTFYYDNYTKSSGWLDPSTTLAGGLFLAGLLWLALRLRKRAPLVALGILWFFAGHLLTSNVFNIELVFEHRNYFALLGVLIAVGDLVHRIPMRNGPALKHFGVIVVIIGFGLLATIRSATWGDPLQLAMDLVAKNPQSPRAGSDLATMYVAMSGSNPESPFFSMGAQEFERASRLPNASPLPEQGLILMAATTGQPVNDDWWDRFIHKVRTRPISSQEYMAVTGLLGQRYRGIELDDRRLSEALSALFARQQMPASMYAQYGDYALTYLHDDELANRMFVAAVERAPKDAEYATKLFSALTVDGHERQAAAVLQRAQSLGLMDAAPRTASGSPPMAD